MGDFSFQNVHYTSNKPHNSLSKVASHKPQYDKYLLNPTMTPTSKSKSGGRRGLNMDLEEELKEEYEDDNDLAGTHDKLKLNFEDIERNG